MTQRLSIIITITRYSPCFFPFYVRVENHGVIHKCAFKNTTIENDSVVSIYSTTSITSIDCNTNEIHEINWRIYIAVDLENFQSVFNTRQTPWSIQCEICSGVAKSASNTKPTPRAFRRLDVVYTGVLNVFCNGYKNNSFTMQKFYKNKLWKRNCLNLWKKNFF